MSTNKTTHYGLHLWEPEDKFLRTEFNENNTKIDAAVDSARTLAEQALEQVDPVRYNLYNLLLQRYYEGKSNGFQRSLALGGFLDGSGIASLTKGLILDSADHSLYLSAKGLTERNLGWKGHTREKVCTRELYEFTAEGTGRLEAMTLYFTGTMEITLREKYGATIWTGTLVGGGTDGAEYAIQGEVVAGQTYQMGFQAVQETTITFYSPHDCPTWLVYMMRFTPKAITGGTMVAKPITVPGGGAPLAWVRHTGEAVGLSLNDGTGWRALAREGSRQIVTFAGKACTETQYRLRQDLGPEIQMRLELNAQPDVSIRVYDYGIAML